MVSHTSRWHTVQNNFARARQYNVDASESMFRDAFKWRVDVNPAQIHARAETEGMPPVFKYRTGGWLPTLDSQGAPVFVDRLGQLDVAGIVARVGVEDMRDFAIWRQETNQQLLARAANTTGKPQYQVLVIQDLRGLGMQHFKSAGLALVKAAGQLDDLYYPESLKTCIIVNAPRLFSMIWNVAKHFFHPNTRKKVQIYSNCPTKVLEEYVRNEDLPTFLGGQFDAGEHISPGGTVPAYCPSLKK